MCHILLTKVTVGHLVCTFVWISPHAGNNNQVIPFMVMCEYVWRYAVVCVFLCVFGGDGVREDWLCDQAANCGISLQGGPQGSGTFLTICLCCADVYSFETEHTLLTADGEDVLNSA